MRALMSGMALASCSSCGASILRALACHHRTCSSRLHHAHFTPPFRMCASTCMLGVAPKVLDPSRPRKGAAAEASRCFQTDCGTPTSGVPTSSVVLMHHQIVTPTLKIPCCRGDKGLPNGLREVVFNSAPAAGECRSAQDLTLQQMV